MAEFVFRAGAALNLRKQQEEVASRVKAEAQAASERAERHLFKCESELASRMREAAAVHEPAQREWYRNWIARQRQDIGRAKAMLADRHAALAAATARLNIAHRDVRVLERLRDRLFTAWQLDSRRKEQKELDWLGTLRHVVASRQQEDRR